jgi:hypothetical protein
MQPSSPVVTLRMGATLGGISLDLSVGISREAFESALAGASVGSLPSGIQSESLDLHLPALCSQMPELLAQGLLTQHRNLAAESLRLLQLEVDERNSVAAAGEAQ